MHLHKETNTLFFLKNIIKKKKESINLKIHLRAFFWK